MNTLVVEWVLAENKIIETEQETDPRDKLKMMNIVYKKGKDADRQYDKECYDSDEGDDREYMNNQLPKYR